MESSWSRGPAVLCATQEPHLGLSSRWGRPGPQHQLTRLLAQGITLLQPHHPLAGSDLVLCCRQRSPYVKYNSLFHRHADVPVFCSVSAPGAERGVPGQPLGTVFCSFMLVCPTPAPHLPPCSRSVLLSSWCSRHPASFVSGALAVCLSPTSSQTRAFSIPHPVARRQQGEPVSTVSWAL